MKQQFKPQGYNSLSAYLVVDDASALIDLLTKLFWAKKQRCFMRGESKKIAHCELQIDDTILMIADSSEQYPAGTTTLHCYVDDVHAVYKKAIELWCKSIEEPTNKGDEPDIRGSFYDVAGNYWAIWMQKLSQ